MLNYALFLNLTQDIRVKDKKLYASLEILSKALQELPDVDNGNIFCGTGGALIRFNRSFKRVNTISVSVASGSTAYYSSYEFNHSTENPREFRCYVYDAAGAAQASYISWLAFGLT